MSGLRTDEKVGGKLLQITAPISHGSSGGPLFNLFGEVIGINAMSFEGGENLNFAIPINDAKQLLAKSSTRLLALPNEAQPQKVKKRDGPPPSPDSSRVTTLQEQQMCAAAAKKSFDEEKVGLGVTSRWYSSHYDAKSSVCFIMTFSRFEDPPLLNQMFISVDNALEHRNYALFHGNLQADGSYKALADYACSVDPIGKDTVHCTTSVEFERLVNQYFNIRQ